MVKWSEGYQEKALEEQLTAVFAREDISGVYIWQFCDCRVCGSWFGIRPSHEQQGNLGRVPAA